LYKIKREEKRSCVEAAIEKLNLAGFAGRFIGNLSKGQKQKVGVAQAILHGPPLIILDEPTLGLDPQAVQDMREIIRGLAKHHTVVFSSHLLHEVELLCDEMTIIHQGTIVSNGKMESIRSGFNSSGNV